MTRNIIYMILLLIFMIIPAGSQAIENDSGEVGSKLRSGIAASYIQLMPLKSPFNQLYSTLYGASLEYITGFYDRFSIQFGTTIATRSLEENRNVSVFLNSYTIGTRLWIPGFAKLWPYLGVLARMTWCAERGEGRSANFFAYGADGLAGFSFSIFGNFSLFIQYNYTWSEVVDDNRTDISSNNLLLGFILDL